jgi:hypothetical protein
MKQTINIIIILISCAAIVTAQEKRSLNRSVPTRQSTAVQKVFSELEQAISDRNVNAISSYFGSQTYFSLSNGSSGYYTSNQAYYILENFFNVYQVRTFRFNNIQSGETNPYGTGVYTYELKGKRSTAQVYISLKPAGSNWKITQLTIN